jgi:uncharacterized protein (TIGR02757 family)
MAVINYKDKFEELYACYNRRELVHPDPLEFLYNYENMEDREIAGLIAGCLAYGSVWQILKSVSVVLDTMCSPREYLETRSEGEIIDEFANFKYRFTTGLELGLFLCGAKRVLDKYGSLQECFAKGLECEHDNLMPALNCFVKELSSPFEGKPRSLLPSPELGSACKRWNLFLRWMIRQDDVDPGGWTDIPPSKLLVPVDIHMHRFCMRLGITKRKQANLRTACEITEAFRSIDPKDPARFDFALTRLGIRDDLDPEGFINSCLCERC